MPTIRQFGFLRGPEDYLWGLPPQVSGCVLFLQADVGVYTAGSAVTRWADQSGAGNDAIQNTAGNRPLLSTSGPNGSSAIQISNATNTGLAGSTSLISLSSGTIFLVAKWTSLPSDFRWAFTIGRSATNGICVGPNTSNNREITCGGVGDSADGSATTNFEAWTISLGPASQALRVNGATQVLSPNNLTPSAPGPSYSIGFAGDSGFPAAHTADALIWAVYVYNRVLGVSDISTVETYIRARTNIW